MSVPMTAQQRERRRVAARFERDAAAHRMTVIRDDGDVYRHVRFKRPDTITYYFDLVTWPGYLAICGDAGDFVFARTRDMFAFFAADNGRINPDYWSEKLQAPTPSSARRYSEPVFKQHVREWLADQCQHGNLSRQERRALTEAVHRQLLTPIAPFHEDARQLLAHFNDEGLGTDWWEWDLRDHSPHFLWCCHAIAWGVATYRRARLDGRDYSRMRGPS